MFEMLDVRLTLVEAVILVQHRAKLNAGDIAKELGVSRAYLYKILSEDVSVSKSMKTKIQDWLNTQMENNPDVLSQAQEENRHLRNLHEINPQMNEEETFQLYIQICKTGLSA